MAKKKCVVFGCLNTNTNFEGSFFSLPSESERRAKWLQLIKRDDLKQNTYFGQLVCEAHFDPKQIAHTSDRKRLRKYTLPSLQLPHRKSKEVPTQTEIKETRNKFVQTGFYVLKLDRGAQTAKFLAETLPSVKKAQEELKAYKRVVKYSEPKRLTEINFHILCDRYLSKSLARIVKAQSKSKFQGTGYKYSPKNKQMFIDLFYRGPQAYNLLRSATPLPNVKTLAKSSLPISTEVNENLLIILKAKVKNLSHSDKICSVVVGTVRLKTALYYNITSDKIIGFEEVNGVQSPVPAKYALVVMTTSIFGNWKQPIGFALLAERKKTDQLTIWIEQLLQKLIDVGLNIRTFISELELDLLSDEIMSEVTTDKPYFFIKNVKIYYIVNAHNLIIALRNNLLSSDFYFNGSVAKYEHIIQFYGSDKNKSIRLAPKLSEAHLKPSFSEKNEVRYATDLFSYTVATAISCYIDFNAIHESARDTVKLIKLMSDLFDILNSSTVHSTSEKPQAFCGSDEQIAFMKDIISFFKSLKLINAVTGHDVTRCTKFIEGFQITITSILQLHEDLRLEGHPYLPTRRLTQEVINKCFSRSSRKQTTRQFTSAFIKTLYSNLIKSQKKGNLSELLQSLSGCTLPSNVKEQVESALLESSKPSKHPNPPTSRILRSDYNNIKLPETNLLSYLAGYILSKCMEIHGSCDLFKSYLDVDDKNRVIKMETPEMKMELDDTTSNDNFDENSDITLPPDFLYFVLELEKCFQWVFHQNINNKIFESIVKIMSSIAYDLPCECFPVNYVISLFTRIRIFITVKYNNKDYKNNRSKCLTITNF